MPDSNAMTWPIPRQIADSACPRPLLCAAVLGPRSAVPARHAHWRCHSQRRDCWRQAAAQCATERGLAKVPICGAASAAGDAVRRER